MLKTINLNFFFFLSVLFLLAIGHSVGAQNVTLADQPNIVSGIAKLTGSITFPSNVNPENIVVKITVPHPISGEFVKYKGLVDASGKFSIEAEVETTTSFIHFSTSLNPEKALLVKLKSGDITQLDIAYNSNFDIESIKATPAMNYNDITRCFGLVREMIEYPPSKAPEPLYNKSVAYFLNHARTLLSERLAVVKGDTLISEELKALLVKDFHMFLYKGSVFDYETQMMGDYRMTNPDRSKIPVIQKIDRSYYRFLGDFKLNDPQYLHAFTFLEFQHKILQNETLALPRIEETEIAKWLVTVKTILSDLVGFKDGNYYNILAANAYGRQLTEEARPLTEIQKRNIQRYWKGGEIEKILFKKNQKVADLDKFKSPTVVHNVASVAADKVIETIVSKHKGKVILFDLWATWCGPCLEAMQRFKGTKAEFYGKDVVFVYLTNNSSPRKLWEEKIKGIGNEHYYLDDKQWEYVMSQFEFEYIPSYLLYNRKGELTHKFSAFPENEEVKKMISGLL